MQTRGTSLGPDVVLTPRRPEHAHGIFAAVDRSRDHLRRWLDWVDRTRSVEDVRARDDHVELLQQRGELLEFVIVERGQVIGKVDLHSMVRDTRTARVGYWLSVEAEGRGLVTAAVEQLTRFAFDELGLQRLEIWTSSANDRSQAVATRLGYWQEPVVDEAAAVGAEAVRFVMTSTGWRSRGPRGR